MYLLNLLISAHVLLFSNGNTLENPTVRISSGIVEGKVAVSRDGKSYYAFLGVLYGETTRFEEAREIQSLNGIYKATKFGAECAQFDLIKQKIVGKENCLFLNLYTPKLASTDPHVNNDKLPVLVWVHGGGFSFGSSNLFMDEPVVLITLNYRLGVFGFLDTQDGTVPGNLGLRDQRLALEWIQKNVHAFNGDRDKITFLGSSAGAASVALHMLTDTSQLFHRAISQSSTSLSTWLIQRNPRHNAVRFAKFLHCTSQSMKDMVICMKSKNFTQLINAVSEFKLGTSVSKVNFLFTPSVKNSELPNTYLTKCPEKLMETVHFKHAIPWMVGFNKNDGIFNLGSILEKDELIEGIVGNWSTIAPWLFVYNYDADKPKSEKISSKIKEHFLMSHGQIDVQNFWKILPVLVADRWEVFGTIKSLKLLGYKIPIYPYIFSYFGNFSFVNKFFDLKKRHGVGHLDELQYLFDGIYGAPLYNEDSELKEFSKNLVKLWVEFAKSGVPQTNIFTNWNPVADIESIHFFSIDAKSPRFISVETEFKERMQFWGALVPPSCRNSTTENPHVELL